MILRDSFGNTPLHIAVENSWTDGVRTLIKYGAKADILSEPVYNMESVYKETALFAAVKKGKDDIVKIILECNPNLQIRDSKERSLLHAAAIAGSLSLIKLLCEKKDIFLLLNDGDVNKNNVLHSLIIERRSEIDKTVLEKIVKYLILKEVNINALNTNKETPLYLAIKNSFCDIANLLFKQGGDPSILTVNKQSVLHMACKMGCHECLKLFLDSGNLRHLSAKDSDGNTPFHFAVESLSLECCELLINHGEHLNKIDKDGNSNCSILLDKMPSADQLLKILMDSRVSVSNHKEYERDLEIKFDFSLILNEESEYIQSSLMSEINTVRLQHLLNHPLIECFLHLKWKTIKFFLYTNIILFFIFLIIHTYYVITTYGPNATIWSDYTIEHSCLRAFHIILSTKHYFCIKTYYNHIFIIVI